MELRASYTLAKAFCVILVFVKGNTGQYAFGRRLPYPFPVTSASSAYNSGVNLNTNGHCCNCTGTSPHQHNSYPFMQITTTTTLPPPTLSPQRINYPFSPSGLQSISVPNYLNPSFLDDRSVVNQYPRENSVHVNNILNSNVINTNNGLPNGNINMNQVANPAVDPNYPGANLDNVIHFTLFTRETPLNGEILKVNDQKTLNSSKFLATRPTKFILHGFADGSEEKIGDWITPMKQAFLAASDSNVIVVDYSHFSGYLYFWTNLPYFASSKLADMAHFLEQNGANMGDFHVVGRLWGAHIAGMTGRMCKGKLGRISGLEPADPSSNPVGHEHQLDYTDAQFVDIVHVNGKRFFFHGARFGLIPPTGHVDIYPNFVEKSSGCPDEASNFRTFGFRNCKRGRGVKYFVDTIQQPYAHPICHCLTFQLFKSGECYCGQDNTIAMGLVNNMTIGVFQLAATPSRQRNFLLGTGRLASSLWG